MTPHSPGREAVERLEIFADEGGTLMVNIRPDGEYVRAHDHVALLAAKQEEVDKMRAELDLLKTNDHFAICDAHKAMNLTLTLTGPVDANGKMCPLCCRRAATVRPTQGNPK